MQDAFERQSNDRKDIRKMAVHFKHIHRPRTAKQKLINNLITNSNSWTGINDLHPKFTALSARDNLTHKKVRRQSDFKSRFLKKEY